MLTQIAAIKEEQDKLNQVNGRLAEVESELRGLGPKAKRHKDLTEELHRRVRGRGKYDKH